VQKEPAAFIFLSKKLIDIRILLSYNDNEIQSHLFCSLIEKDYHYQKTSITAGEVKQ